MENIKANVSLRQKNTGCSISLGHILTLNISKTIMHKKVNVGIIVQLSKDLMDWVSQILYFAFGGTDRSVSWTSIYSLIQ